MSVLRELIALHRDMLIFIKDKAGELEREAVVEKVNLFHNERQPLLEKLTPPQNEEERSLANDLIQLNEAISRFIQQSFAEVKTDIQQHQKKKQQTRQYADPYAQQRGVDGAFYDKRK